MKEKKPKLNFKHKLIVDHYFINGCVNQTESYLAVYTSVTNRNNARIRASEIFARDEVKDYLEHQQKNKSFKNDLSKEKMIQELSELILDCKTGTVKDHTNWAKAIQIVNRMFGYDEPEKHEVVYNFKAKFGNDD